MVSLKRLVTHLAIFIGNRHQATSTYIYLYIEHVVYPPLTGAVLAFKEMWCFLKMYQEIKGRTAPLRRCSAFEQISTYKYQRSIYIRQTCEKKHTF